MSIAIGYDKDNRMEFTGLTYACGNRHDLPHQDIYVGTGLISCLPLCDSSVGGDGAG